MNIAVDFDSVIVDSDAMMRTVLHTKYGYHIDTASMGMFSQRKLGINFRETGIGLFSVGMNDVEHSGAIRGGVIEFVVVPFGFIGGLSHCFENVGVGIKSGREPIVGE